MINLLLLQAVGWEKWVGEGVAVMMFLIMLGFLLRALPTWKEIKIEEFKVRTKEAETSGQVASSLIQLGTALGQLGETIKDIAVEQRQSTEAVKILQRVNATSTEQLTNDVQELTQTLQSFNERLDHLENQHDGKLATNSK